MRTRRRFKQGQGWLMREDAVRPEVRWDRWQGEHCKTRSSAMCSFWRGLGKTWESHLLQVWVVAFR